MARVGDEGGVVPWGCEEAKEEEGVTGLGFMLTGRWLRHWWREGSWACGWPDMISAARKGLAGEIDRRQRRCAAWRTRARCDARKSRAKVGLAQAVYGLRNAKS